MIQIKYFKKRIRKLNEVIYYLTLENNVYMECEFNVIIYDILLLFSKVLYRKK